MSIFTDLWVKQNNDLNSLNLEENLSVAIDKFNKKREKYLNSFVNNDRRRRRYKKSKFTPASGPKYPCFRRNMILGRINNVYNRGVISGKNLVAGERVFISQPFAAVVRKLDKERYCLTCHEVYAEFLMCNDCGTVFYCSPECKSINVTHRYECETFFHEIDDLDVKLTIQMVFEAMATFPDSLADLIEFVENETNPLKLRELPKNSRNRKSRLQCILKLECERFENRVGENLTEAVKIAKNAFNYMKNFKLVQNYFGDGDGEIFLQHLIVYFTGIIHKNGFDIQLLRKSTKFDRMLIYEVLSYFNHSCSPNLINIIDGNVMTFFASEKIHRERQLFINYYGTNFDYEDTVERRRKLQDDFGFPCACRRCKYVRDIEDDERNLAEAMNITEIEEELNRRRTEEEWTPQIGAYIMRYVKHLMDKFYK